MKIIFKIKEIRQERGLTLQQLSNLSGISIAHINYIESNTKQPTIIMLELLKKALKLEKVEDLYDVKW